ncbi:hypothetical protein B0H63DRAFT_529405 [Podospora didyma]|uniref:Uncharacterized protein n=1 Tax=Podospora didyma TaxID=330526 RepID=A0AAE0K101_9PEZI|nr:hypothetical protein B0H63DRAFT_529405 [Podospora didyma]
MAANTSPSDLLYSTVAGLAEHMDVISQLKTPAWGIVERELLEVDMEHHLLASQLVGLVGDIIDEMTAIIDAWMIKENARLQLEDNEYEPMQAPIDVYDEAGLARSVLVYDEEVELMDWDYVEQLCITMTVNVLVNTLTLGCMNLSRAVYAGRSTAISVNIVDDLARRFVTRTLQTGQDEETAKAEMRETLEHSFESGDWRAFDKDISLACKNRRFFVTEDGPKPCWMATRAL